MHALDLFLERRKLRSFPDKAIQFIAFEVGRFAQYESYDAGFEFRIDPGIVRFFFHDIPSIPSGRSLPANSFKIWCRR